MQHLITGIRRTSFATERKSDGNLDWLTEVPNPEGSDFGFADFMVGVDAVAMGRSTFDFVAESGQWPYEKPVYVLSRSLESVSEQLAGKVEIVEGSQQEIIKRMKSRGHEALYVDAGNVVQQFLNADLVDELILLWVPVLLGEGIRLFSNLEHESRWEHIETEVLAGQIVKSRYIKQG